MSRFEINRAGKEDKESWEGKTCLDSQGKIGSLGLAIGRRNLLPLAS